MHTNRRRCYRCLASGPATTLTDSIADAGVATIEPPTIIAITVVVVPIVAAGNRPGLVTQLGISASFELNLTSAEVLLSLVESVAPGIPSPSLGRLKKMKPSS